MLNRIWHKLIPMKYTNEQLGIYRGTWNAQMDRYWESNDGYTVSSRKIRTEWGLVEHVAVSRMGVNTGDIPWAIKQEIKNELFGAQCTAIEVFPAERNLVDVCDVYHLWVLPGDFKLPFGIHPTNDPQCYAVSRMYDFKMKDCLKWTESEERKKLMSEQSEESVLEGIEKLVLNAQKMMERNEKE